MIPVSEQFLSHQGEGPSMGVRAVFLRLYACNLLCGGGKYAADATWTCDSIPVFTKIQKKYESAELLADWQAKGWLKNLKDGAHLVITGGEPLLPDRQAELIPFLKLLCHPERSEGSVFIEVETNTTITPTPEFDRFITQYNCSPKLANSGMPRDMSYQPDTLRWHVANAKSIFKFVVSHPEDIHEIQQEFITPLTIPAKRIWLMPAASTRSQLYTRGQFVAQCAQENGWNYSSRLHIQLYDQTTGV